MNDFRESVLGGEFNRSRKLVGHLGGVSGERLRAIEY